MSIVALLGGFFFYFVRRLAGRLACASFRRDRIGAGRLPGQIEVIICVDRSDLATIPVADDWLRRDIVTSIGGRGVRHTTASEEHPQSAGTVTAGGSIGNGF